MEVEAEETMKQAKDRPEEEGRAGAGGGDAAENRRLDMETGLESAEPIHSDMAIADAEVGRHSRGTKTAQALAQNHLLSLSETKPALGPEDSNTCYPNLMKLGRSSTGKIRPDMETARKTAGKLSRNGQAKDGKIKIESMKESHMSPSSSLVSEQRFRTDFVPSKEDEEENIQLKSSPGYDVRRSSEQDTEYKVASNPTVRKHDENQIASNSTLRKHDENQTASNSTLRKHVFENKIASSSTLGHHPHDKILFDDEDDDNDASENNQKNKEVPAYTHQKSFFESLYSSTRPYLKREDAVRDKKGLQQKGMKDGWSSPHYDSESLEQSSVDADVQLPDTMMHGMKYGQESRRDDTKMFGRGPNADSMMYDAESVPESMMFDAQSRADTNLDDAESRRNIHPIHEPLSENHRYRPEHVSASHSGLMSSSPNVKPRPLPSGTYYQPLSANVKKIQLILRLGGALCSVLAFVVMLCTYETRVAAGSTFHVKFSDFQAYNYLVALNMLSSLYSTGHLINFARSKSSVLTSPIKGAALVYICDQMVAFLLVSSSSSAATASGLSYNGWNNIWPPACSTWSLWMFCSRADSAIAMAFFSSFLAMLSSFFSGYHFSLLLAE